MNTQQIVIILAVLAIAAILIMTQSKPTVEPPKPIKPLFPPPALPPGGSYYPNYTGTNCSSEDQMLMAECQDTYTKCINDSLVGKADFPTCHQTFMDTCMPVIRRCQE